MVNNDYQRHLEFQIYFQIDKRVTFHVRPVNEYDPEFTGDLDITITEVGFSFLPFFLICYLWVPYECTGPVRRSSLRILYC